MAPRRARLSPLDAAFLYFERPHQRLHVGCVALLDGPVPFDAFVAALDERLAALPRYRQRPVRPLFDLDWPRWEDDPAFDVRRHVRHVAVPSPGGEAELRALVDTLFATPLDDGRPLWETYLIAGLAGGGAALLCKTHHSMIDGVSGAEVLRVMADPVRREPEAGAGVGVDRSPATPPGLGARLRAALSPAAFLERARDAAEMAGTMATLVLQPASTLPFNGPLTDARRIVWASFALDDVLAIRGSAGCKVNDVVLTIIAGALRRYLEARSVRPEGLRVRTLVPVSTRGPDDQLSLGNLVAAMFPRLPVDVADPVERLRGMAEEMRRLKERGQARASGLALRLAGSLPAPVEAIVGRLLPDRAAINTVCTNVPGPRDVCSILGRSIVEIHPIVPLFQNMGLEFAILSYAGRLSICAAADPHLVPDADTIPGHLTAAATELGAALGLGRTPLATPSTHGPRVADLMTAHVTSLTAGDTLVKAYLIMRERRIRHLPVVGEGGRLIGLLTHRDLLAASSSSLLMQDEVDRVRVLARARAADVMETHVSITTPEESAAEAGERMIRYKIGCLPVVDPHAGLVGIVTEEDFLRWATAHMAPPAAAERAAG